MAEVGTVVEGKYEILKLIGRGGMSKVYLAMDKNLNKQWAIKEIQKEARNKNNEVVVQSAIAEANMMKKLDHPCLPRIVDIINHDNVIYVVMDYIEGEPLSRILNQNGAQPQEAVLQWAESLCGVLDYLHNQNPPIIYRDMKPANIMLQPNGNIKLIDFGIAREYKEQNLEDTVCLGTKGYAAPEQFGGRGQTDRRTDVYCLGVTLYHLLTGMNPCDPPYEIYPIRHWNPTLSAGLENIIIKCTQLNPEDRFDSCAELLYALRHLNESDEGYRSHQKRKVGAFFGVLATSIVLMGAGFVSLELRNRTNNSDFQQYMIEGDNGITKEDKIAGYQKAIGVKPDDINPYLGMIKAYKEDALFTVEEESEFKKSFNVNLPVLRENEEYGKLAYEFGKIYWYYYDYGSDESDKTVTRMTNSVTWFEDAVKYGSQDEEYYQLAEIYSQIGNFYKEITMKVQEADDHGSYARFFVDLEKLNKYVSSESTELIKFEVYKICFNSLETYAAKIATDDYTDEEGQKVKISKTRMRDLYKSLKENIENTATSSDKTKLMKEELIRRSDDVEKAVEDAYYQGVRG